ncbi:MAG: IS66 family transposase [Proteobacteria bacterium]|nr:IS66 family transposase [Pseudomonadota bacterium]
MDKDAYIKSLEDKIESLEKRIEQMHKHVENLQRRLGMNSQNSSKPPSSDPPGTAVVLPKKRRKKRGARKGHPPHLRSLLPPEKVTQRIELVPEVCLCGCAHFKKTSDEPVRHQLVDLPPIEPEVTEYIQPVYRCQDCGELVYQSLPDEIKRRHFGPGVLALVGILTGSLNTSKRKALALINELFGVPMSLGGLSACEEQIGQALARPHQELLEHIQQQPRAHADETGWRRGNRKKGWLWTLCCNTAAVFVVQAGRGQVAAKKLLGTFGGVLHSDRWSGYNCFGGRRQLCWAHLKRDFKALSEAKGLMGRIGGELSDLTREILSLRKRVRDGTLLWQTLQRRMEPLMQQVENLLEQGADSGEPLSGQCRRIFNQRHYLWTFVQDAQVEPTNNFAERTIRQAVLWRKGSFGTQSERGARYAERILSVCTTCRLQGRSVIEYLRDACSCHLSALAAPPLIYLPNPTAKTA